VCASNVFQKGHTVPWGGTVWLVLNPANVVNSGEIRVDLSAALKSVGTVLENNYGWTNFAGNYWLDTIAFGMEFGPKGANLYGSDPTAFSLNLTSYCLGVATTVAAARCCSSRAAARFAPFGRHGAAETSPERQDGAVVPRDREGDDSWRSPIRRAC
jgi:hypothetical protein